MKTVRIGIIGPSWWVNYWHLPALQNHPHAKIVAVCGAKLRTPEEVQAKYGESARAYTDLETMLDEAAPDGVIVCTPNDLHYPSTMAALRRGIHVTCEKPVALNADQAQEMAETAKARGLLGMTNFPYRDNPAVQTFRRMLADGHVGKILHVSGQYHGGFGMRRPPGWRGLRARSGAGILGDLGSHLIDLALYITGEEFTSVCASTLTLASSEEKVTLLRTEAPEVGERNDDSCAFLATFASGAQGIFHTSWLAYQGAYAQHQELEVYGTLGRLRWNASHAGTILRGQIMGQHRWETIPVEGTILPSEDQAEEEDYFRPGRHSSTNTTYRWIEAIATGRTAISPDLTDGWRSQQVIDAVIRASASQCWEPVI